jgi:hypothetical protein
MYLLTRYYDEEKEKYRKQYVPYQKRERDPIRIYYKNTP